MTTRFCGNGVRAAAKTCLVAAVLAGLPGAAHSCRLALVFAVDVSRSVNSAEYAIQFKGLAQALRDREIQRALFDGGAPVALSAFEWSGVGHQRVIADWKMIRSLRDVEGFARRFEGVERTQRGLKTAIGSALVFAEGLFARGPACAQQVVDVSSDGYNNRGIEPKAVYKRPGFKGVTVNALVVSGRKRPVLKRYFEDNVIHGPGAFAMATESFDDYVEAIRLKMLKELRRSTKVADRPVLDR